jgi:3-oxoacyl-[acyl-carrier-protein] synthase-3
MRYHRVYLEAIGYHLPEAVVTSDQLEARLAPAYERLRLPAGRLELMSGIRERRFFPPGMPPSQASSISGRLALAAADFDPSLVGALVHGSVCRDFLEPATACGVHHALGLSEDCQVFDVSTACLGVLAGAVQIANMIELGQIRAGLVVGTECGRSLVESTVRRLNEDASIDRQELKQFVASLTIGSASVAMLLCDEQLSRDGSRWLGGAALARTTGHELCQSEGLATFMRTDSEALMRAGVDVGAATFERFLAELGWRRESIDKAICHQVGVAHRRMLFERLGLDERIDYATLERLGNTGAAALPATAALAAEAGWLRSGDRVGLLGIGSGVNCLMLGVEWNRTQVRGNARQLGLLD